MDLNFSRNTAEGISLSQYKFHLKIKRIQQTNNYDVILQNNVMMPLVTLFAAQTPVVYNYPFISYAT